jgi:hypothetical protein
VDYSVLHKRRLINYIQTAQLILSEHTQKPTTMEMKPRDGVTNDGDNYSFDPLPIFHSFRTLELLPGHGHDPVQCNLRVHANETVSYEALSYCWGDPALSHHIRVNGDKRMAVTANLHAALRRLRLPDRPRVLWADGCCINQSDAEEKSRQVRQMGNFYQYAERVLVYLGEDADGSERIPQLIDAIHMSLAARPGLADRIQPHTPFVPPGLPPPEDEAWLALRTLFLRPWWGRCWIIQEVVKAVAVELVCGRWVMDWERFAEANRAIQHGNTTVGAIDDKPDHLHERTHVLKTAEKTFVSLVVLRKSLVREQVPTVVKMLDGSTKSMTIHKHRPTWHLIDLLERGRDSHASDDRDYVYAMLGLSVDEADGLLERTPGLVPDYTEPAARTFIRYARHIVMWGGAIKLLYSSASHGLGLRDDLPSWVPNWSARGGPPHVLSPRDDGGVNKYYAAASSFSDARDVQLNEVADQLKVSGVIVGRLSRTGAVAPAPGPAEPQQFSSVFHRDLQVAARSAEDLLRFLAADLRTSPPHLPYIWRTLCCDVDLHTGQEILRVDGGAAADAMSLGFDAVRKLSPLWSVAFGGTKSDIEDGADTLAQIPLLLQQSGSFLMRTVPLCLGRRVAALDDVGQLAQVPPASEPGDVVFLPLGSAVPFVLRPARLDANGSGGPFFRLLGECYVHGAMKGEMLCMGREIKEVVLV